MQKFHKKTSESSPAFPRACPGRPFGISRTWPRLPSVKTTYNRRLLLLLTLLALVCIAHWLRPWGTPRAEWYAASDDSRIPPGPSPIRSILPDADPDKLVPEGPPSLAFLFDETSGMVAENGAGEAGRTPGRPLSAAQIQWVWVPPGTFQLGTDPAEAGYRPNEGPPTQVTLTRGFWLARCELTFAQYHGVLRRSGQRPPLLSPREARKPVTGITWQDAVDFCARLTDLEAGRLPEGYVYRLPTEAEWEFACRAGTTGRFGFATPVEESAANRFIWSALAQLAGPQEVGRLTPNPWGLHDMHGNVAEWVLDVLPSYPGGEVADLLGTTRSDRKVVRGGSWNSDIDACRSGARRESRGEAEPDIGFRVALAPKLALDL